MAYRNGTYVAFDGQGQQNPISSDFKYYGTIQAWSSHKHIDFNYVDSHEKTWAVKDSSLRPTLEARIRERLSNSKNVIVILSSDTRKLGSMLSYEIEQSVDKYNLPLIITYVDYKVIANPESLFSYWPNALSSRVNNNTARAIHIPFYKDALLDAISQFNIGNQPKTALNYYDEKTHRLFGCLTLLSSFSNLKK